MALIFLIARIVFSMIFFASGANHLMDPGGTVGYAESRGLKNAKTMVQVVSVVWLVGGLSVILGIYGDLGALILIGGLLACNILIHHFWTDTDPMTKQMEMTNFMKNNSMIGGALAIFAVIGQGFPVDYTITDGMFSIGW